MLYRSARMATDHDTDSKGGTREKPGSGGWEPCPYPACLNSTRDFHRFTPVDLMKEFTICESFARPESPYSVALERPRSYGAMVGDFLIDHGLLGNGAVVCEMGGGYGSLMSGLLSEYARLIDRVYMLDLSKRLLQRQRDTLRPWLPMITSIQGDIHELADALSGVDLFIVNEVMGDLNAMTGIHPDRLPKEAEEMIIAYGLEIPDKGPFNLNIGALKLVEALCRKNIPAFLTEHSSDPIIPDDMDYLKRELALNSYPREIRLFKHSEFTIRFSHLIKAARAHGRKTLSGSLLDLVNVRKGPDMRMIFTARACGTERQEIIFELLDHIREYRWLIIS